MRVICPAWLTWTRRSTSFLVRSRRVPPLGFRVKPLMVFGGYPWFYRPETLAADTFPWSLRTSQRAALLSPDLRTYVPAEEYVARRYHEALEEVPRLEGEDPREARMREMLYLNITRFLPTLLDRKDRMTMAFGLEVRVPYCDHRLVEYVRCQTPDRGIWDIEKNEQWRQYRSNGIGGRPADPG